MNCSWPGRTVAEVLLDDAVGRAPSMLDVAFQPADESQICVGVDVHLQIEAGAQRWIVQHQDSLDDDHGGRSHRADDLAAVVHGEVVGRGKHRLAGRQPGEVIVEQFPVIGIGMVVVRRDPHFPRLVSSIDLIRVEPDQAPADLRPPGRPVARRSSSCRRTFHRRRRSRMDGSPQASTRH